MKSPSLLLSLVLAVPFSAAAGFELVEFDTEFTWLDATMPESLEIGMDVSFSFEIDVVTGATQSFSMDVPGADLFFTTAETTFANGLLNVPASAVNLTLDGQTFAGLDIGFSLNDGATGSFWDRWNYEDFTISFARSSGTTSSGLVMTGLSIDVATAFLPVSSSFFIPDESNWISSGFVMSAVSFMDMSFDSFSAWDQVPEPSALSLITLGGLAWLLVVRRRR